jgi:hypothetical protein
VERGSVKITPASAGFKVLSRFEEAGYAITVEGVELRATGPAAPIEELRVLVQRNREALKAAILLSDPPGWLAKLFDLYWNGHQTSVKMTIPRIPGTQARLDFGDQEEPTPAYPENLRGGKTDIFMVSVSIKNICAAVAAEIGAPVLEWERLRPEVEEALGVWEGAA